MEAEKGGGVSRKKEKKGRGEEHMGTERERWRESEEKKTVW